MQEQFHISQVAGVLALKMAHRGGNINQNSSVLNYSTFSDSTDCYEITINFVL